MKMDKIVLCDPGQMIWPFYFFGKRCDFRIIGIKEQAFKFGIIHLRTARILAL